MHANKNWIRRFNTNFVSYFQGKLWFEYNFVFVVGLIGLCGRNSVNIGFCRHKDGCMIWNMVPLPCCIIRALIPMKLKLWEILLNLVFTDTLLRHILNWPESGFVLVFFLIYDNFCVCVDVWMLPTHFCLKLFSIFLKLALPNLKLL